MARGILSGLIWGAVFVVLVLSVLSLSMPLPQQAEVTSADTPVIETTQPEVVEQATPVSESSESSESAMVAPALDEAPVLQDATAGIQPTASTADSMLDAPEVGEESEAEVSSVDDTISVGATQTISLPQPADDFEASIFADPVQPEAPVEQSVGLATEDETEASDSFTSASGMTDEEADALLAEALGEAVGATQEEEVTTSQAPEVQTESPVLSGEAGFGDMETGVVTNRLPNVTESGARDDGPLAMNAEPFLNADDRPLMSVVLIDTGQFNIGPEALMSFPYPLTFAVDPLRDDAIEVAQSYRDAGFEVLAISDLPETGDGSLPELVLAPMLDSMPGLVGILEGTEGGLQGNMPLAEAVLGVVEATGYGLVLRPKGLNAAQQQAEGRDLPVATVFRDFDANGQDATVIRRFLDQAAFKARQKGGVIMVGRVQPTTISALLLWGLQDRANSVALAPISAVLTQ